MAICAKCEVPIRGEHTCPVRTAGDYALLHANGMSFREIVKMIRVEALEWAADKLDNSDSLRDHTDDHMGDVHATTAELRALKEATSG